MRGKWIGILSICIFLFGWVLAEEVNITQLTGTVSGPDGTPVADAELNLYMLTVDMASMRYRVFEKGQAKSNAEGDFSFSADPSKVSGYSLYCCLAQKEGLSCGWGMLTGSNQTVFDIHLTEPEKMIGFVQNPDGTPVPEAEVRLVILALPGDDDQVMFGIEPVDLFATKTCEDGRFEFNDLPSESTAEFLVRKPGKGTLCTLDASANPSDGLTYKAGQTDIMLTMQDGLKISGKVLIQEDQKPAKGIPVLAMDSKLPINLISRPQETDENGAFEFDDLAPGNYRLSIQDDNWLAEPLSVPVGENVEGVVLQLTKGGLVEINVVDSATEEGVSGAVVNLRSTENGGYQQFNTDESGIAKKQVVPGTYQVNVYAQGYRSVSNGVTVTVENNQTATATVQLGGQSRITGVVLGPAGNPVADAEIQLVPGAGSRGSTTSDEKGEFKLAWDPEQMGWTEGEFYLVVTAKDKNLAGVASIDADTKEMTVKLRKGAEVEGKVINEDGEPIAAALVQLYFRGSRFSTSFGRETKTDDNGQYIFNAVAPEQRYYIQIIKAEGYGTGQQEIQPGAGELSVAVNNIVLRVADQKLSGQVVDIDGKGLANVQVYCYGDGQPQVNVRTDEEGKFAIENVCPGEISISANYQNGSEYMYGNVQTEGGAEDIKIVLTPQGGSGRYVPRTPPSLVGKPLPDLTACGLEIPADARAVLVFAWDMNQRPSRYFVKQLAEKAELLNEEGVTVVLLNTSPVEGARLNTWLAENGIDYPCGVMGDDAEDMKFKMGIKSLPWLILTDAEHTVIAEGFSAEELEDKLSNR